MKLQVYIHTSFKGMCPYTKELQLNHVTFKKDNTDTWESDGYTSHFGKLLQVTPLELDLPDFDPITTEIEVIKAEMANLQATTEMTLKSHRDRINDLLMIGHDAPATVEDVTDKMAERRDADMGFDKDLPF